MLHHPGTDSTCRFWTSLTHCDLGLEHTTPHCIQWSEHYVTTQPWLYTTKGQITMITIPKRTLSILVNLETQSTTRMALVRELQCSMSNTNSRTDKATRSAGQVITFFCFSSTTITWDSEEPSYRHTSDSSQRSSLLRNKGPWSHWSDWTSSDLGSRGQQCYLYQLHDATEKVL